MNRYGLASIAIVAVAVIGMFWIVMDARATQREWNKHCSKLGLVAKYIDGHGFACLDHKVLAQEGPGQ